MGRLERAPPAEDDVTAYRRQTVNWMVNATPSGAGLPRLEHQVGRFLSIFEERLTRKA